MLWWQLARHNLWFVYDNTKTDVLGIMWNGCQFPDEDAEDFTGIWKLVTKIPTVFRYIHCTLFRRHLIKNDFVKSQCLYIWQCLLEQSFYNHQNKGCKNILRNLVTGRRIWSLGDGGLAYGSQMSLGLGKLSLITSEVVNKRPFLNSRSVSSNAFPAPYIRLPSM